MFIAWTSVASSEDADRLARTAIAEKLAACVQVDGPITSHYRWKGTIETSREFRLTFKCLPEKLDRLETRILGLHPYSSPEWIVVRAERVSEKYLSWARADLHSPTL